MKLTKKTMRTLAALLLAALLALPQGAVTLYAAEQTVVHTVSAGLTRVQARDIIFAAAVKYNGGLKPEDIMSGYPDGSVKEGQTVTRAEALVMINRAFGALPKPGNDWARITSDEKYTDVPAWAASAFDNLYAGRILAPGEDGLLKGGEPVTADELDTLLHRVYALYGTRLEDDFFAAVNKEWLDTSTIPEYGGATSVFTMVEETANKHVDEIVTSLLNGKWEKGTAERKITDVYRAYLDFDAQTKSGAAPLKHYLDKLAASSDMKSLEAALADIANGAAFFPFLSYDFNPDYKDSMVNVIYMRVNIPFVVMADNSETTMTAYAARLFELAGYPNPQESAKAALSVQTALEAAFENAVESESMKIEEQAVRYTAADLQKFFPGADVKTLLTFGGLKESPVYIVAGVKSNETLKTLGKLYSADNVSALRAYAAYKLLDNFHMSMGTDFMNAYDYVTGEEPRVFTAEEDARYAQANIKDRFTGYISQTYAARYFTANDKKTVTDMIHTFIENYRGRISGATWLSDATKKMALKKLDTMVVKVGWSDKPDTFTKDLNIVSIEDGGSLVGNLMTIERRKLDLHIEAQGKPVDREAWAMPAYDVNACYSPMANDITFPAAILQAPFFSSDAKPEENLAAIGWVIAHEITHAFDVTGSQFDENGNAADWWTTEDKASFERLCAAVVDHYDGTETAPGIKTNGWRTQGENTADLGGLSCAMEALKKTVANPDYALFFKSFAKVGRYTADREDIEGTTDSNPHSTGSVRINKLVHNFDEFYEAFNIKPGDGMYVAPEKRVKIW